MSLVLLVLLVLISASSLIVVLALLPHRRPPHPHLHLLALICSELSGMERKVTLDDFKVGSVPTLIYIPDFITDNEQTMLLNKIYEGPVSKWKSLKNRRLQNWGSIVHEKGLLPQD
ncbi:alkylated DNA repair protein ALKBH6 homolog [Malus domestica]|uniref:alkylated DNA repair protein ALKBH6 homolog n=1 Tax=Malus domestica TaxID=3750 RepID=UPI0039759BDF